MLGPCNEANGARRRDPWVIPFDAAGKRALRAIKTDFSAGVGGASDHLILVKLYNDWAMLPAHLQHRFASENYLSNSTLLMIHGMRAQLVKELAARGLLQLGPDGKVKRSKGAACAETVRCVLVRSCLPCLTPCLHTRCCSTRVLV